ncbi:uncharacterized protein LOC129596329 isoform X1 [Paramacrobiotus metropolitanus]|uniref:uncharacterized protein LOC129596329 isoform X1 n=1 Tax=Paramacrobiotus metropolitanus TaxID=2943436 RepID=UPI002446162B|nr:uncharacterized protein LOC129596329 isoform X1 [Paramacrobiotus metropolitanus]
MDDCVCDKSILKKKLQIADDSGVVDVVAYNQIQQQLFGHSAAAHQSGLIGVNDFSVMNKQYRVILKQAYSKIEKKIHVQLWILVSAKSKQPQCNLSAANDRMLLRRNGINEWKSGIELRSRIEWSQGFEFG